VERVSGRTLTDPDGRPVEADAAEVLGACAARGDLAARWFLRSRARGDTGPSEEHARRVAELEAAESPTGPRSDMPGHGARSSPFEHNPTRASSRP